MAMASVNGATKRKDADSGNAALPLPVANSTGGVAPEKRRKIFVAGDSPNGEPAIHLSLRSERNELTKQMIFSHCGTSEDSDEDGEERKRLTHVSAEQKRRDSIKTAFDSLKNLLPQFKTKANVSKAVILKAAIEFIGAQPGSHEEILRLRRENEELKKALRYCDCLIS